MKKKQDVKKIKRLKKGIIEIASKDLCQLPRGRTKTLMEIYVFLEDLEQKKKKCKFRFSGYLKRVLKFISKLVKEILVQPLV